MTEAILHKSAEKRKRPNKGPVSAKKAKLGPKSRAPQGAGHKAPKQTEELTADSADESNGLNFQDIDEWGWKEIPIPQGGLLTGADDMGGMMCFEELTGVHVVSRNTEDGGKQISFKKSKAFKHKKSRADRFTAPLSEKEMRSIGFMHVDSFLPDDDEKVVRQLKRQEAKRAQKAAEEAAEASNDDEQMEIEAADIGDADGDSGWEDASHVATDDECVGEGEPAEDGVEDLGLEGMLENAGESEGDDDSELEKDAAALDEPVDQEPVPRPELALPEGLPESSSWTDAVPKLSPWLLKGLLDQGFTTPTDIQEQSLPLAITRGANVVGAAETGSGKTLAFGLPILNYIASSAHVLNETVGLIVSPTRELAMQISKHLKAVIEPFAQSHAANCVNIVTVVGGMSEFKQRRLLTHKAHVLVATPGRLWGLIESGIIDAASLRTVRFFVLDEADKMLERGKFKELENIIGAMAKSKSTSEWGADMSVLKQAVNVQSGPETKRQTLIFSATLPTSGPSYSFYGKEITLRTLLKKLNLKSFKTVDVTTGTKTASTLIECKIECVPEDKDVYLYYLLTRYPGRTLVFVNAIATIRRLAPLLRHLRLPAFALHAQMQQRKRLKNLDRFAKSDRGILIASDVAARGLDIHDVEHVVHYQVPPSSDLYVHRSGRTARAQREGLSIVMVSPKEIPAYRKICQQLGRPTLSEFAVETQYMNEFRKRLNLARRIEGMAHKDTKKDFEDRWLREAAEALDVELSDNDGGDSDAEIRSRATANREVHRLKAQLKELLDRAILGKELRKGYLQPEVAQVLNQSTNATMPLGAKPALQDLKEIKRKRNPKKNRSD